MTIFLTSDEHYNHKNIITYCDRPFADVNEMNRGLIERHNSVVQKDDIVWHVGDFSLNEKIVPEIFKQLNGGHYLVSGNHDPTHACHRKHAEATRRYLMYGFRGVYMNIDNFEGKFLVTHMPYAGDRSGKERYPEYRMKDEGKWLLHGHIHTEWKVRDRMINVGVDVWDYKPVPLSVLFEIAK